MLFKKKSERPTSRAAKLSSLIGEGVEIIGDLRFANGVRIDGRVKGDVIAQDATGMTSPLLVLSEKGSIEGNVRCADAVINGAITGDLEIEHFVELQSRARVCGTIRYRQLQMDVGATVQGNLIRIDAAVSTDNVIELGMDKPLLAERR